MSANTQDNNEADAGTTPGAAEKPQPNVRVVYKPVAAKKDAARTDPCVRAEAEDDDGYDPYSDRQEVRPMFESDPWS